MSDRDTLHVYLKSLGTYLSRLEKAEADEVVREIESHIHDAVDALRADGKPVDMAVLLEGFGDPRDLAAGYVDHILTGTPPPKGFKAIERVKKTVTFGLVAAMALFGFGITTFFLVLATYKVIDPGAVGVWTAADGNALALGIRDMPSADARELLGGWLTPAFALLAAGSGWLTVRVVKALNLARR